MKTILVCGGRDFTDRDLVYRTLDEIGPAVVVHGACGVDAQRQDWHRMKGADYLADCWAKANAMCHRCPANWTTHGRKAGALRNQAMLDEFKGVLDLVVAFPGGPGTEDMCRRAKAAGIEVRRVG